MKSQIDTVNGLIPSASDNFSVTAQSLKYGAVSMLESGSGLSNKSHRSVSQHPQAAGFVFEHLQAIGLNISAELKGSRSGADQISVDRMKKLNPDLSIKKVGEIISNIQAKAGAVQPIEKPVISEYYSGKRFTNSENADRSEATISINIDGVKSVPVNQYFAEWVAENPYLAANVMNEAAKLGKVSDTGLEGAAINTIINILFRSLKTIGAYCRDEQEFDQAELYKILEVTLAGLKTGFLRGVAIKVIQKLMDGSAFAALGFTVGIEVIPTLIKVLKDEMTLEQAITAVGPRMLTSAVITTVVVLFPTLGTALLSASVIKAIWEEISPEWKIYISKMGTDMNSAIATGSTVIAMSEAGSWELKVGS
ncbi:hypothetical protein M595_6082 [Lyngbya aestuarii BL J]|uniref:Uncharacterized protein n=1 Tax=Lyngbya aestuarii BL J TaxID=1348334 RepID=U7QAD3_9CYAN|nr:hypothetical protein [Lyngbya aestuarii]ERT03975.1 hypothetical protein M595_6082 [Lyngbya aestuarii BL J]